MSEPTAVGGIETRIMRIRGQKVLLDRDLAELYGVTLKRLREQIRRNPERFPDDFMFQLTEREKTEVAAKCGDLGNLKFSPTFPLVFTEHGALMAANVLNSTTAIRASLQVIRAFTRLREFLATHQDLARKLADLEDKYDDQFREVFEAIWALMDVQEEKKNRKMGFVKEEGP